MSDVANARYAIGVDLGTTHSAVASVELARAERGDVVADVLAIPQTIAPGEVEGRPLLPSFLYLPHPEELPRVEVRGG